MKTMITKSIGLTVLFVLLTSAMAVAQSLSVKGKITDAADGSPLIGVSVTEKGTANGVTSDIDGRYSIQVKKGSTLVFSYIGYETKEVKAGSGELHVSLDQLQIMLDEVIVGYGAVRKEALTGAVARVGSNRENKNIVIRGVGSLSQPRQMSAEEYSRFTENRFLSSSDEPLSTFSIDVDAASYSNVRRYINQGQLPPKEVVRTEELINYFSYEYGQPTGSNPVKITTETGECPWNSQHRLFRIGIKVREIADDNLPASNLVFLIDVSGSMYGPTRLELVKSSLKLLINNLREKDKVAIVVYSGSAGEVLPSTSGSDKQKIREALDKLTAGGSTAGGAGIKLAYSIAKKNFIHGGNNRVILCSDGDFNVGVSSKEGLEDLIANERQSGVFLTVLGYGMGNYKDNRMQTLAEKGNGNHAYIDNLQEANKVLVQEFGGTMYAVAKDVKLQIEFNPAQVQAYRLIGYESRLLNKEDFNDDTKDAGEMGAGHTVTAFYEIIPAGVKSNYGGVDALKYQSNDKKASANKVSDELLTVKLRYKEPEMNTSKKIEIPVKDTRIGQVSADFRFASAVAMFGQLLGNSDFKGTATYDKVIALAREGLGKDEQGYRREFVRLAESAKGLQE